MKKLILILLLGLTLNLSAQTLKYKCTQYFYGTIYKEEILWDKPKELTKRTILKMKDNHVVIENGKHYYDAGELFRETFNEEKQYEEYRWYSIDKDKVKCILILIKAKDTTHIYFEYSNIIFGYNIVYLSGKLK